MSSTLNFNTTSLTVRLLEEADRTAFDRLCARAPLRLLTPRINIAAYGFQSATLTCRGAFHAASGELLGLLVRFSNTVIAVDENGDCAAAFARALDEEKGLAGVRGTVEVVRGIRSALTRYGSTDSEDSWFLRLTAPPIIESARLALARRATPDDLDALTALYSGAGPMHRSRSNLALKLSEVRVFVVEEPPAVSLPTPRFGVRVPLRSGGRLLACALLNVEGPDAGLIGGVYTLPEARGRGYAAACTAALALDLQRDGKLPCLFYENPTAGRVYRRLGFEEAGHWAVLYLAPTARRT